MLVSTTGSFQLVHSQGVGRWAGDEDTPAHPHATDHTGAKNGMKDNKEKKKYNQTRCPPHREEQNSNSAHPNLIKKKVKEKCFQKHNITFVFLYPTSSSIATLIVQQGQYIFIIILRYLLYFSEYLQLYKQSTHFKVHKFNTVLTSFAFTRFIFFPKTTWNYKKQKNNQKYSFSYILQKQKTKGKERKCC